ncbi:MAG: hypothetical protein J0I06_12030 [Planctomycetes bacterium]|nr:hypothetical protein [Planctomycetota bacterium]
MFRPLARSHRRPHRRGTSFVLIVVVMISFAAAVGVAFALFAGQTLRIAAANKEAQGAGGSPPARAPEPANTVNQFLSALIFGVGNDSPSDLTNALRGHSIAASMYGSTAGNTTPWAGVGTFSEDMSTYGVPGLTGDRSAAVNYTQMQFTGGSGSVRFLLDPEWTGYRASGTTPAGTWPANFAAGLNGRTYVGKHAPYSFPDLKDFFAGAVDPATGQVLVQSFHRPWLWNMTVTSGTTTTTYGLDPGNPNWTNTPGRLKTLRPRPAEHPLFPRVPPNYDNSYTGDVQNWPGGYTYGPDPSNPTQNRYNARNDSLWMHIGLPTVPFGNRMVQPLVAPLIVPLDGLLNASAHGNNFGPNGAHLSYAGYGPWEVNVSGFLNGDPATALSVNRSNVVAARGTAQQRSGNTVRSYDPYRTMQVPNPSGMGTITVPRPLPTYSPVAWSGAQVGLPTYPAGNSITGLPSFPAFQSDNALVGPPNSASHPALFNPAEWPTTGGTNARGFPLTDIKRMHLRYAFTPDWYIPSDLASNAPQDLGVNRTFSYAVVANTASDYRLDPAHPNRALFTTRGFGLDRPKVAPNFATRDGALGLAMAGNKPGALSTGVGPFPAPGTPLGTVTDFTAGRWVNRMAVLGAVDINRPLTDYRVDMTKPLTAPNNVTTTSAGPADNDRRKLAHDIFVRLAAATGASLQISLTGTQHPTPQYAVPTGLPAAQLNALRYLAQLAVNVVDYRDDDDISTAFVWNPIDPTDPYNAANFAAAEVGNRVVFGVEKSRLVLNEVYSEIANAPTDPVNGEDKDNDKMPDPLPTGSLAHVRFWAELLNPTSTSNVTGYGPIDDNVSLTGYQIQIARANRTTGAAAAQDMASYVYDPANTTGSFPVGQQPDASFTFTASTGNAGSPTTVAPNNGTSLPSTTAPNTLPKQGVVLVAPPSWTPKTDPNTMMPNSQEFDPQPAANTVWAPGNVLYSPALGPAGAMAASPGMGYTLSMSVNANNNQAVPNPATTEFRRHVVLLRRLANPYVVPDPASPAAGVVNNPYVTVDVMDYVPSFDAVGTRTATTRAAAGSPSVRSSRTPATPSRRSRAAPGRPTTTSTRSRRPWF